MTWATTLFREAGTGFDLQEGGSGSNGWRRRWGRPMGRIAHACDGGSDPMGEGGAMQRMLKVAGTVVTILVGSAAGGGMR